MYHTVKMESSLKTIYLSLETQPQLCIIYDCGKSGSKVTLPDSRNFTEYNTATCKCHIVVVVVVMKSKLILSLAKYCSQARARQVAVLPW